MAKPKVTTLEELQTAVESIKGNVSAKKFLSALLEELAQDGQVSIEHGDIKGSVVFLDISEEETEDEESEEEQETEEDYDEDEDEVEDEEDEDA